MGIFLKKIYFLTAIIFLFSFCLVGVISAQEEDLYDNYLNLIGADSAISDVTSIKVSDQGVKKETQDVETKTIWTWLAEKGLIKEEWALETAGSKALQAAIYNSLQTLAYDTATWIGSGNRGQKPMFITEGWGEYMTNIADNAAGEFLTELSREWGTNLCEPDELIKLKIFMGMTQFRKPRKPACTFSKMKKNWEAELLRGDFLNRFQDMFEPTSNDLGVAIVLYSSLLENEKVTLFEKIQEREEGDGWLRIKSISGRADDPPGEGQSRLNQLRDIHSENLAAFTGDALVDAANVFLNQLAISLFNRMISSIGRGADTYTSPYDGDYGLSYYSSQSLYGGGTVAAQDKFKKIIEPNFKVRGDYNILAELSTCPDPTKAGATNCVITGEFRQAIEQRMTVGEAMRGGYLRADGVFGFNANGLEPTYTEGFPYRSMIILRKYRILPVGWELAAEYINDNDTLSKNDGFFNFINAANAIGDSKTLEDLLSCFSTDDDYDNGFNSAWCRGLVDPNWVLMAPLNYCKREGPGPEILSKVVVGEGTKSEYVISRKTNYCADEQTCIKEDKNGACEFYGYCTEERRKWDYDAGFCDPNYNTCQTFRKRSGDTISMLQNTLDFGSPACGSDNVGCADYLSADPMIDSYVQANDHVEWAGLSNHIYFDKDANDCAGDDEGCHEFIRTKAGFGTNLVQDGNFENVTDPIVAASVVATDSYFGSRSFSVQVSPLIKSFDIFTASPISLEGDVYTFSIYAKNCGDSSVILGNPDDWAIDSSVSDFTSGGDWQRFSVTHEFISGNSAQYQLTVTDTANCLIDGVKLERGVNVTPYVDYRANSSLAYEKLLPDYLAQDCYVNYGLDYRLTSSHPEVCDDYARLCNSNEVDCQLYTSLKTGLDIPAKVQPGDYCPEECNGYDAYVQSASNFDSQRTSYLIPDTSQSCSAEAVGCDQFTNIDKLGDGAEEVEYYTYMKQCVTSTDENPNPTCSNFFTWEGSDDSGYQLRSFVLQNDGGEPYVYSDVYKGLTCEEATYDFLTNPMCREFYNQDGDITYKFINYTVTCSDNCHPYRRTEVNIDPVVVLADCNGGALCSAVDNVESCWDDTYGTNGACVSCLNGGRWSLEHQACIYMAIPGEGEMCSASQNGCREYSGNSGADLRVVIEDDFEDGTVSGWNPGVNSNTSLVSGEHSLNTELNTSTAKNIGNLVETGHSYILTFMAYSGISGEFTRIGFGTDINDLISFNLGSDENRVITAGEWRVYEFNMPIFNNATNDYVIDTINEKLFIEASNGFYIDNIRLVDISDRYYLIKGSSQVPDSCYNDIFGEYRGLEWNLGCSAYSDENRDINYLRQFSELCQDSSVGCELMIDTHNSENFNETVNGDITVPADNFAYVIYNDDKTCFAADKGCELLGQVVSYDGQEIYRDVYKINNPDSYENTLCSSEYVGCEEWSNSEGTSWFKDPGNEMCEWRQGQGVSTGFKWYKTPVKRCDDGNGVPGTAGDGQISTDLAGNPLENNICLERADCTPVSVCGPNNTCAAGQACVNGNCYYDCIVDKNDYECATNPLKTFGYGGDVIEQPLDWAGLCSAKEAGCTEYIDPVSNFSPNILFNGNFSQDVDANGADGWSGGDQQVHLENNSLYVLRVEGANSATISVALNDLYLLDDDNNLGQAVNNLNVTSAVNSEAGIRFYAYNGGSATISANNVAYLNNSSIELKKALVEYQLKQDVDKNSCNGVVDLSKGCVLFNEREKDGSAYSELTSDADRTDLNVISPCLPGECDSNVLLKVEPARSCDVWLACKSYIKDENGNNVCYDVGLCNSADKNNNCDNFVITEKTNQTNSTVVFDNMSGYNRVGYSSGSFNSDLYSFGNMDQDGEVAEVSNGNFEIYGSNNYPNGWIPRSGGWNENLFMVINNPISAQFEAINYPMQGKSFLKFSTEHTGTSPYSEYVDLEPNTNYTISFFINTLNFKSKNNQNVAFYLDMNVFDSFGNELTSTVNPNEIFNYQTNNNSRAVVQQVPSGEDWKMYSGKFRTGGNVSRARIQLVGYVPGLGDCLTTDAARNNCMGNIYIDDINIKPVLLNASDQKVSQTCRLYPESDSLACNYYEESGNKQKGWLGYCLQYDRYPGDSNTCLLWYPIDKVKGEEYEDGLGYRGRFPVYYATEFDYEYYTVTATKNINMIACPTVDQAAVLEPSDSFSLSDFNIPDYHLPFLTKDNILEIENTTHYCREGDIVPALSFGGPDGFLGDPIDEYNQQIWLDTCVFECGSDEDPECGTLVRANFNLDGELEEISAVSCSIRSVVEHTIILEYRIPFASKIVQTVTLTGQNKFWSGRVYEGSNFVIPCNIGLPYLTQQCNYLSDYKPFGSIVPPGSSWDLISNPYEWDSKADISGYQPLYFEVPENQPRAGQLISANTVRELFAQSYGTWEWNGSRYAQVFGEEWIPPVLACNGTGLPLRPAVNDYCGILPRVDIDYDDLNGNNIKVNNSFGNVYLKTTGFANLTFNTIVDSQQQPMAMRSVDWGDNEKTVVSGIEIRDQSNTNNPHSLYHLYNYWDMLDKHSVDQTFNGGTDDIYCGEAGNATAENRTGAVVTINPAPTKNYCVAIPGVKIKDNWGWCNNGSNGSPCPVGGDEYFSGYVIVTED